VTGGVLTEEEGTRLFSIHDQLKGIATKMFVIPPASAPAPLIARMYESGATPSVAVGEDLPNPRVWSTLILALISSFFVLTIWESTESAQARMAPNSIATGLLRFLLFWAGLFCARMWWLRKRQLRGILADPVRMAIMEWTPTLPPFGIGRRVA